MAAGKTEFWESLRTGSSGVSEISLFDTGGSGIRKAGEIKDFDPVRYLGEKGLRSLDRSTLLLTTAAKSAIDDASLAIDDTTADSMGVSIGATFGSLHSITQFDREGLLEGPRYVNPSHFPNTVINSPASRVSISFGIKGFNATVSTGMCASIDAMIYAMDFIKLERADCVLAGGVEELCEETFLGFYKAGLLSGSDGAEQINCPFDMRRNGFVLSEGSAVLVLERLENALERGATIYAEILGAANRFDASAYKRCNPEGTGLKAVVTHALADARLSPSNIDLICAHADSSREGDRMEAHVLEDIFGETLRKTSVTAVKSITGETYSASGALSAAACIGAINHSFVPPTLNYEAKDPECRVPNLIDTAIEKKINTAIVMSYDFHGNNAAMIIGDYKRPE